MRMTSLSITTMLATGYCQQHRSCLPLNSNGLQRFSYSSTVHILTSQCTTEGDFLTINIGSGSDAGSITVTQFTPALGQDYGIVLNDYTVAPPVTDITDGDAGQQ